MNYIKRIKWLFVALVCVVMICSIVMISNFFQNISTEQTEEFDKQKYNECNAVVISLGTECNCDEEFFSLYSGKKTVKYEEKIDDQEKLSQCVNELTKNAGITKFFIYLDPVKVWADSSFDIKKIFKQYKDTEFDIILLSPSLEYWLKHDDNTINEYMEVYQKTVDEYSNYRNVRMFFFGAEKWINYSKTNYEDGGMVINQGITNQLVYGMYAEKKYMVNSDTINFLLQNLKNQIKIKEMGIEKYPNLSGWTIAFLGDSITGLETTTTSIPSVIEELSNAKTYNLSIGGIAATSDEDILCNFNEMVDALITNNTNALSEYEHFIDEMKRFKSEYEKGKRLCFVINFGLNDYFMGYTIDSVKKDNDMYCYTGALKAGIEKLKREYPESLIIVMSPTYVELFETGTKKNSEEGGVLLEYVVAAENVANEEKVYFMNNYMDLNIDFWNYMSYLSDGVHFNGNGRYYFAKHFINYFTKNVSDKNGDYNVRYEW